MKDGLSAARFWAVRLALTALSGFFIAFGVSLLRAAYRLNHPGLFIMTFFASNFIILISAALGLIFIVSMIRRLKGPSGESD